jgi:predicted AAA+ superfamily ATPase
MKRSKGPLVQEEKGALFEGLVAQVLRAYKDYQGLFDEMFYWAPLGQSGTEVDFILIWDSELIAVEAKAGNTFTDTWCRGLRAVEPLKGLRRRIIVYPRGPAMRTRDGIDVLPFQQFAGELAAGAL